ncbi:Ig-like domain-containing protein [Parabacteroides faecis]|uniref:BIG2 domain-containing protein n=2 Tax=Parabacteroides TaxID=375288 RepID=A0ABR6KRM0_9BACT|nr:Ig-like domain-containing protein [Parabacteroides faecis]MBB4624153.1 hypothetical protein [Parabacteroides faecis]MBC8620673.1 Ig-like domain-containing protein [Parabacteroides faecis]
MKKNLSQCMMLITAFVFMLPSCSEDEKESIGLTPKNVVLKAGDTIKLEYGATCTWTSDNDFIASVSNNGMVTANHVGNTFIKANDDLCEVKVSPVYDLYKEPCIDWNKTKSEIINMYGTPDLEDYNSISYNTTNTKAPAVVYFFNNNKLSSSTVMVDSSYLSDLTAFLSERYEYAGYSGGTYTFYRNNNNGILDMGIGFKKLSGYRLYTVMYIPSTDVKSISTTDYTEIVKMIVTGR